MTDEKRKRLIAGARRLAAEINELDDLPEDLEMGELSWMLEKLADAAERSGEDVKNADRH